MSQRPPPQAVRRHLADEFVDGQRSVVAHDGLWPGRFAQILPPKVADDQIRLLAKTMLKVKGVKTAKTGTTVRLPRTRR